MADIDDEQERRRVFAIGQGAGVAVGLREGFEHGAIPRGGTTGHAAARLDLRFEIEKFRGGIGRGGVLLGLKDEAVAAVEVDAAGGRLGGAAMMEGDGALKDVGVGLGVGTGGVGTRDAEQVAKLGEEEDVVGALGGLGVGPAGDELGDGGGAGGLGRHATESLWSAQGAGATPVSEKRKRRRTRTEDGVSGDGGDLVGNLSAASREMHGRPYGLADELTSQRRYGRHDHEI